MNTTLGKFLLATLLTSTLLACGQQTDSGSNAAIAIEIDQQTSCALDGMLLADFPGPKGQIHYANRTEPEFYCDLVELFHIYLTPEVVVPVRALYVQDMGKADWNAPEGHWINAKDAWFVPGSSQRGSMGPTIASFADEADAQKFATEFGGTVVPFDGITSDMVVLDGAALHDKRM